MAEFKLKDLYNKIRWEIVIPAESCLHCPLKQFRTDHPDDPGTTYYYCNFFNEMVGKYTPDDRKMGRSTRCRIVFPNGAHFVKE